MIIDNTPKISSIGYSTFAKELTIKYTDGNVVKYMNVPQDVYEAIVNNGKELSNYIKENLESNYKKLQMV